MLPLATILLETYGSGYHPEREPKPDTVDQGSGLTAWDQTVLERAQSILAPQQIETLKESIADSNRIGISRTHHEPDS